MFIKRVALKGMAAAAALTFALGIAGGAMAGEAAHPHWTYEGEHGPEHWAAISHDYAACGEGKTQSPIDIGGAQEEPMPDIGFSYKPSKINILNNGHTVQVNYDAGSSIKVDGADYSLAQFHFHDPSEHTVGGKSYAMELHLVHKNAKGGLAVVGVLIGEGKENAAFARMWKDLPKKADDKTTLDAQINAEDLLPKDRAYYRYAGSLTTPPCSEGVTWLVLKEPIEMSKAQVDAFRSVIDGNARPVQPLEGRKVRSKAAATH
ncbi:MAG: carbonic anhydrase family protein [Deltaproteobacteria bacterium]|nr:carbonic anhydrase family protein [Deltaproteobacteria bacterium]